MRRRRRNIHVLVVDDSAVVRQALATLLSRNPEITVETAPHPPLATEKIRRRRPDVVVLDIEMPHMDGLTFLRKIMAEDPMPVVICSGHAQRGTRAAIEALSLGAADVIGKPSLGVRDFFEEAAVRVADTVRAAAEARVTRRPQARSRRVGGARLCFPSPRTASGAASGVDVVVAIGASTGGPQALQGVLGSLPRDAPGLLVVQHMPEGFTAAFARRLDEVCEIEVREARDGDALRPGLALIAPGNRHLELTRTNGYVVRLSDGPLVSRHRPSVDVLFHSVSRVAGARAVGVILTGMGDDGVAGLAEMKRAGAAVVVQDEATSVVFGMPREAIARVKVDRVVALPRIAASILGFAESVASGRRHAARQA